MYNWFSYLYIFNGSTIQNTITSTFLHMQLVWFWVDRLSSKTWVQLVMITSTTICQKKKEKKSAPSKCQPHTVVSYCQLYSSVLSVPVLKSHLQCSLCCQCQYSKANHNVVCVVSASTQKPTTRFSAVVPVLKCQPQCSCAQCQYLKANHTTTLCCNSHLKSWPQFVCVCVCVWSTSFCCGRCT